MTPVSCDIILYQSGIPVIVRPRRDLGKSELRIVNIRNLQVVKPSRSSQKVDEPLSVCCMNVQSLNNTDLPVADFLVTQGIDIVALTETWLGTDSHHFIISESVAAGYGFLQISRREDRRRDGVVFIYKSGFNVTMTHTKIVYNDFQHMDKPTHHCRKVT